MDGDGGEAKRIRSNSWVVPDVTAAMLVYRTIAKKVFWECDSIIAQNLSDILLFSVFK